MNNITPENIKEIAEQLDCGFRAFVHKTTGQMLFVPNENDLPEIDLEAWDMEWELLENNFTSYYEIEKWTSNEAFEMMTDFIEQLSDNKQLKNELRVALNKRKPFREFKYIIENSGDFRQQWFDFKNKRQQEFVEHQLGRL